MTRLIRFIPLILFIALGIVLYRGLALNPNEMPSALVGKPLPTFALTTVADDAKLVTNADLQGNIMLLNVWATWCPTCRYEHPYLLDIAKNNQVKLYGINYKDDRDMAKKWLQQLGDPYQYSLFDDVGKLGLDLGVYGAPETFVIDAKGVIRKRFAGAIDANVWQREFAPLIAQLAAEQKEGS